MKKIIYSVRRHCMPGECGELSESGKKQAEEIGLAIPIGYDVDGYNTPNSVVAKQTLVNILDGAKSNGLSANAASDQFNRHLKPINDISDYGASPEELLQRISDNFDMAGFDLYCYLKSCTHVVLNHPGPPNPEKADYRLYENICSDGLAEAGLHTLLKYCVGKEMHPVIDSGDVFDYGQGFTLTWEKDKTSELDYWRLEANFANVQYDYSFRFEDVWVHLPFS